MRFKKFIKGESYAGFDRQGDRVTGIITGILITKWSIWLGIRSASGFRLIQEKK